MKTLFVILGATASGKTDNAVEVAKKLDTEIISCDSRQFYRELNIGVARPSGEALNSVKHHLIGHISVQQPYNVYKFEQEALTCLKTIFAYKDNAVMVGGSGLYIDALCYGIADLPDPTPTLRIKIKQQYEEEGLCNLLEELRELDPNYYDVVDKSNPIRVIRALEVCKTTGKQFSELRKFEPRTRSFNIVKIGLQSDRNWLYDRINQRVDNMMNEGLLDEARMLTDYQKLPALKTVGYSELFSYLMGKYSLEEAVEKIKINTRRYAKRQNTWFRRYQDIEWIPADNTAKIIDFVSQKLGGYGG